MEIRRSVIARPNLSWRVKISSLAVSHSSLVICQVRRRSPTTIDQRLFLKENKQAGPSRRLFPFQCASRETREAPAFPPSPSGSSAAVSAAVAGASSLSHCGAKPSALPARCRRYSPRRHSPGMPEGRGGRKPDFHIIGRSPGKMRFMVSHYLAIFQWPPRPAGP